MCGNLLSGLWGCIREFWALIIVCGGGLLYNRGLSAAETRMPPSPDDRSLHGGNQRKVNHGICSPAPLFVFTSAVFRHLPNYLSLDVSRYDSDPEGDLLVCFEERISYRSAKSHPLKTCLFQKLCLSFLQVSSPFALE